MVEPLFLEALPLLLERVEQDLAVADQSAEQAEEALNAAITLARDSKDRAEALRVKRAQILAMLTPAREAAAQAHERQVSDLMDEISRMATEFKDRRAWTRDVIMRIEQILRTHGRSSVNLIYEQLGKQGVSFAGLARPKHRIQQLLYQNNDKFETDRANGWALRNAGPAQGEGL